MFLFLISLCLSKIPNYQTRFFDEPPPDFQPQNYVSSFMQKGNNSLYQCYVSKEQNEVNNENPDEFLKKHFEGKCFYFTHTEYWYFHFCPFQNLTQFRYNEHFVPIDNFTLGVKSKQPLFTLDDAFYEQFEKGDKCIVTGKPRTALIRYTCDQSSDKDVIVGISESNWCSYYVHVATPQVCRFPYITEEKLVYIDCIKK